MTPNPPTPTAMTPTAMMPSPLDRTAVLYATMPSPVGELLVVGVEADDAPGGVALTALSMTRQRSAVAPAAHWRRAPERFVDVVRQIEAYFAGEARMFDLTLHDQGSTFRQRVWRALEAIPYGETISYRELAGRVGAGPRDARAIGSAVGANPLLLVRPCHRVIGADGSLRGFAAGLDRKEFLLRHEGALAPTLDLTPKPRTPASDPVRLDAGGRG